MRLIDFQAYLRAPGLPQQEQRTINASLFPVYEAVRLWLKDHVVEAPFRKVLITLADASAPLRPGGGMALCHPPWEHARPVSSATIMMQRG